MARKFTQKFWDDLSAGKIEDKKSEIDDKPKIPDMSISHKRCANCFWNEIDRSKGMKKMDVVDTKEKIQDTLIERNKRYGNFFGQSFITQKIKSAMKYTLNWEYLSSSQTEALEMIANKIGRILNGDPKYIDSWHDIAGYATLIEQELKEKHASKEGSISQASGNVNPQGSPTVQS